MAIITIGSKYIYVVVVTANLAPFLAGVSLAWTSPMLPKLKSNSTSSPFDRAITSDEESWIMSLTALGSTFGPLLFIALIDRIGRKVSVMLLGPLYFTAYLMLAYASNVPFYYAARFIKGLGVGGTFSMMSIYLVEIAPVSIRGKVASSPATFVIGGILFTYCLGPYVSIGLFNQIVAGIALGFIPLFYCLAPETPFFHIANNSHHKAKQSLSTLRRKPSAILSKELEDIKLYVESIEKGNFTDIFKTKGSQRAFIITIVLTQLQQFSGINVIQSNAQTIFEATGSDVPADISSIIIGLVQFSTSYLTPLLADRTGRRTLFLISVTGAIITEATLGLYFFLQDRNVPVDAVFWLPIVCLVLFVTFYNCGFGSLPWATMGEILPISVISVGAATTTSLYWLTGFFMTKYFGAVTARIGMGPTFWLFAGTCVVCDLFVYVYLFEMKGLSLKEVQDRLNS